MTGSEIADVLAMARRHRCGAQAHRAGQAPHGSTRSSRRIVTSAAGPAELLHIDVKKLGKINGAGWRVTGNKASQNAGNRRQRAAAAVPRAGSSSMSASTTPPAWPTRRCSADEKATTAVAFLRRALAFYAAHGIRRRARDDR